MERDSGIVVVDQQIGVPELGLAIVEQVVGNEEVLVVKSQLGQVGEAPSGAGAKPPLDLHSHRLPTRRVTLSTKLARLMSGERAVQDGGSQPVDSFVRLAENDELSYVHVERRVFSLGYEKGGAMQFAAGGYMHPEVRALRRAQRRSAMRMQLEMACVRDAETSSVLIPSRIDSCVSWSSDAPVKAASRVARVGPLASALRAGVPAHAPATASSAGAASALVDSALRAQLGVESSVALDVAVTEVVTALTAGAAEVCEQRVEPLAVASCEQDGLGELRKQFTPDHSAVSLLAEADSPTSSSKFCFVGGRPTVEITGGGLPSVACELRVEPLVRVV